MKPTTLGGSLVVEIESILELIIYQIFSFKIAGSICVQLNPPKLDRLKL